MKTLKKNMSQNLRFSENRHFMKQLCTSLENGAGRIGLEASYARYVGSVQRLVVSEYCTPLDMLHTLSRARNRLVQLCAYGEQHPAVMDRLPQSDKPCSTLYQAEQFSPTDLMELITALHSAGVGSSTANCV